MAIKKTNIVWCDVTHSCSQACGLSMSPAYQTHLAQDPPAFPQHACGLLGRVNKCVGRHARHLPSGMGPPV